MNACLQGTIRSQGWERIYVLPLSFFGCKGHQVLALAFWVMVPCILVYMNRYDVIRFIFKQLGCDVKCLLAACC